MEPFSVMTHIWRTQNEVIADSLQNICKLYLLRLYHVTLQAYRVFEFYFKGIDVRREVVGCAQDILKESTAG